jgi:UDP-glucose 6-dehydrogenase
MDVEHGMMFPLITVGTPWPEDGSADLRYVLGAARTEPVDRQRN